MEDGIIYLVNIGQCNHMSSCYPYNYSILLLTVEQQYANTYNR